MKRTWRLRVDTGGTFTDCLAVDPEDGRHRIKVLSSSAVRGLVEAVEGARVTHREAWRTIEGFADGAEILWLDQGDPSGDAADGSRWQRVVDSGPKGLEVDGEIPAGVAAGSRFELRFDEEAPILAARLVTRSATADDLPPLDLRLGTTRGTNALLERRGARTAFFVTRGFADLLVIRDQRRPDLFAREIRRPAPLYDVVIEVTGRLAADGSVVEPLDPPVVESISALEGVESAAVALLHAYRDPSMEERVAEILRAAGLRHVSISSSLSATAGYLRRAETAVVDAYLSPGVGDYLDRVRTAIGERSLRVMTSAGGLVRADRYRAKDSLLSGPAGGVVGAARAGRELGFERVVAFDMGGTSTDVSRIDGDLEYRFEHAVGDATVAAPALAIETVAAGGGSICRLDGRLPKVGPQSAGASPGPASYGAGGPLTLTDVNLLLGRLDPERFGLPIVPEAAEARLQEMLDALAASGPAVDRDALLLGFLDIADQRMADAVRRISVRRGYDPADYALVAFGGAGGQHACAVARELGMSTVLLPREAGILSAVGLDAAVVERFAERQVLEPLESIGDRLGAWLTDLENEAVDAVVGERIERDEIEVRRRLVFARLVGQESTIEIPIATEGGSVDEIESAFRERYAERYGYRPRDRAIEIESLRVVASSRAPERPNVETPDDARDAVPEARRRACFAGTWREVATYDLDALVAGERFDGPALVFDRHAALVVEEGWRVEVASSGLVAQASSLQRRPRSPT